MYYKTRLKFNILVFMARPRPSKKRFRSTKIDFFDSGKKLRTDPRLEELKLARNQKIRNLISFGNSKQNATFRRGFGRCLRRFCLISSTNIENIIFLPRANFKRSTTGRFDEKCAPQKTLQNQPKIQNIVVFATSKTSKYVISIGFSSMFCLPKF